MIKISYACIFFAALISCSCSEEYLDKKPDKSIVVPSTLTDLQALLDNSRVMNITPAIGVLGADDLFMEEAGWEGLINPLEKNGYLWAKEVYEGQLSSNDWNTPYEQVFYANVVLEGLDKIGLTTANETEWKSIRGRALFYRAFAFYELAQLFCEPYSADASASLGIPLRLTADVGAPVERATVKETYDQILLDLQEAAQLLPETPDVATRPTSVSNKALLARVYLSMEDYENAEAYASAALERNAALLDYNNISATSSRPFQTMHEEVLFHASMLSYRFLSSSLSYIDTLLYASYSNDDLRKGVFFRSRGNNRYSFKGSYTGNLLQFAGISNNEVYLIRAECRVRNGDTTGALEDLNALLEKRYRASAFVPVVEDDPDALLALILNERRKELVFRSTRWTDLRRLNHDTRFQKTLSRELNGAVYTLPPNDARYVYPIPFQEISISGIPQNVR